MWWRNRRTGKKDQIEIKRGGVTLKTFQFANGSVKIISAPAGATVSLGGRTLGRTPLLLDEVKPGDVSYQLQLTGFKAAKVEGKVRPNDQIFLAVRLDKKLSPVRGEIWQNSLGMRFVPIGGWHISAWETRGARLGRLLRGDESCADQARFRPERERPSGQGGLGRGPTSSDPSCLRPIGT